MRGEELGRDEMRRDEIVHGIFNCMLFLHICEKRPVYLQQDSYIYKSSVLLNVRLCIAHSIVWEYGQCVWHIGSNGVATCSRLLKITGLFCKRAL